MKTKLRTRNMFPQVTRLDFGYDRLLLERMVVVADVINGLVASLSKSRK